MFKDKILLIELAGIGDSILSSPAIRNLRKNYPCAEIYFLSFNTAGEILIKCPYLNRVFMLNNNFRDCLKNLFILQELRRMHVDVAINLGQHYTWHGAVNMALLFRLIRPRKSIGRNTDGKGFFYDIKIDDTINTEKASADYKLNLIQKLGCEIKDRHLEVWFDDYDAEKVKKLLVENQIQKTDILVGINPEAKRLTRRWDYRRFAEVAEKLSARDKIKIVITGTKKEAVLAEGIIKRTSAKLINFSGKLSLMELIALVKRCNLFITGDTAPMHIANALKIPLVVIMGPGSPKTAPYQKRDCIILQKDVGCNPCYRFKCRDMRCMKVITPKDVISAAESLLNSHAQD